MFGLQTFHLQKGLETAGETVELLTTRKSTETIKKHQMMEIDFYFALYF